MSSHFFLVFVPYRVFFPSFCLKMSFICQCTGGYFPPEIYYIGSYFSIQKMLTHCFSCECNSFCCSLQQELQFVMFKPFLFFLTVALSAFFLNSILLGFLKLMKLYKWMYFVHFFQFYHYKLLYSSSPLMRLTTFRVVWPQTIHHLF